MYYLQAYAGKNHESFSFEFIENPLDAIEKYRNMEFKSPELVTVMPEIDDEKSTYSEESSRFTSDHPWGNKDVKTINSGDIVRSDINKFWEIIPFHLENAEIKISIKSELDNIIPQCNDFNDVLHFLVENESLKKIRQCMKDSKVHKYNMIIYSGSTSGRVECACYPCPCHHHYKKCYEHCRLYHGKMFAGCLYMGDFDAKSVVNFGFLTNKIGSKHLDGKIDIIQIPHHGSKHNFNPILLDIGKEYIVFAGKNNKYKHPHQIVLEQLLFNDERFSVVSEHSGSKQIRCYYF